MAKDKGDEEKAKAYLKEVDVIDKYFLILSKPNDFNTANSDNIINTIDKSFEQLCASLEESGVQSPKKMTTFEFNQRVDYYQEKAKKIKDHENH